MGCCIGRPLYNSQDLSPSGNAKGSSARKHTANHQDQPLQMNMSGRKTPESQTLSSNSEENLLEEIALLTGRQSALEQRMANLTKSMQMFSCDTTQASRESELTMPNPKNGPTLECKCSGEDPVWAKPVVPGLKRANAFMSKTQTRNGGTAIVDKKTSSLTNSPESLPSTTYSDGWTGTLALPRSKDTLLHSRPFGFGSPPTWIQGNGTQTSTPPKETHYSEE